MTRRNRTISETTYVTEDGRKADLRIDVGEPEPAENPDHFNVVTSASIREQGNRAIMDNQHAEW